MKCVYYTLIFHKILENANNFKFCLAFKKLNGTDKIDQGRGFESFFFKKNNSIDYLSGSHKSTWIKNTTVCRSLIYPCWLWVTSVLQFPIESLMFCWYFISFVVRTLFMSVCDFVLFHLGSIFRRHKKGNSPSISIVCCVLNCLGACGS